MSKNKSLLARSQGKLFTPRYSRQNKNASSILASNVDKNITLSNSDFKNTNLESSSSFRYGDKPQIVSTQQLKIDWTRFENHTFFHSAIANVNESFDKLVNFYPFDKSQKDIEIFEDNLTGYEKHILDQFPKNVGYLNFSGTAVGESLSNGTHIKVKDRSGASLNSLSDRVDGSPVLDPKKSPFSFEFFINIPAQNNDNQIVFQKLRSVSDNITLALSESANANECEVHFGITSGSNYIVTSGSIKKGSFSHVTAMYDRLTDQKVKLLINDRIYSSSQSLLFDNLNYDAAAFNIGTGEGTTRLGANIFTNIQTFSGSLDDFRLFHAVDPITTIKKRKYRNFYPSSTDPSLKLYYKFNEPYGTHTGNNIVLDSSGNSLHEKITNFNVTNRLTGSDNPVKSEDKDRNPVLFPTFSKVSSLNTELLTSASNYDDYNPNIITRLIPKHYFQDATAYRDFNQEFDKLGSNFTDLSTNIPGSKKSELPDTQLLIKLLLTYAKYFDELKLMIDTISNMPITSYDDYETAPDIFLPEKAKMTNTTLPYLFTGGNLSQYFSGIDLTNKSLKSVRSLNEVQNLIWRRILTDAPKMKLYKGTVDSIKNTFRNAGIEPDNIFTFREYGGSKEKSLDGSRELKRDVYRFVSFTGSLGRKTTAVDPNGYPTNAEIPRLKSGYLSGSRIQTGVPNITKSKATATITVTDGDAANGMTKNTKILIANIAGQTVEYIISDTNASGVATGIVLSATSNVGGGTNPSIAAGNVGIAVGLNLSSATQNNFLTQLRAAILHSNNVRHKNNITVSAVPGAANGNQSITLTHVRGGLRGNNTVTETITNVAASGFTGGTGFQKSGNSFYHGVSTTPSDGLFTSGSFTYEALYDWEQGYSNTNESLVRLHVTGTSTPSTKEACLINLVASNNKINLYMRNSNGPVKNLYLTGVNVFDKDVWYVSFGRKAGHDLNIAATSSYFLRAAKQQNGDIIEQYTTSSFFEDPSASSNNVLKSINIYNTSGSFLVIGSQSFQEPGASKFLNDSALIADTKVTNFHGLVTNIRFFSKNTSHEEFINRAKNYDSYGVKDPKVNYNFANVSSGSFERLILHTDAKQGTQFADSGGKIRIFDFSQNNLHFMGSNFKGSANVMKNLRVDFEVLSDKFDLNYTRDKIRIRSFQDAENLGQSYFSTIAPVHEILPSEESLDDNRLSLDMSVMKGLNDNALRMFNNFDALDDALGRPNLIFGDNYQDLRHLREVYFNNVIEVMDLKRYRNLFKWIDNSFTDVVYSLVPRTTNFLGINFIYESHVLERNRFKYYFDEIYMKSGERDPERGNIFLSQFVGRLNRY
jgi:hypothetical protein